MKNTNINYAVSQDEREELGNVMLPHFSPYSFVTKDYKVYPKLRDFERNFEIMCRQFIKETSPDRHNKSYFDAVIEKYCSEAARDIDQQRVEHIELIRQGIAGSQKGLRIKKEKELQGIIDDINARSKELAKYKTIYYKGTSIEEE